MDRSRSSRGLTPLAIQNVRVCPAPDLPPIPHATVLVQEGCITAVSEDLPVPPGATVLSGDGRVVTAGFWNAHVHFTEGKWRGAGGQSGERLESQLEEMLTCHGFTTVVDTGSDPRTTLPMRARVESESLRGPRILTSGPSLFPARGIPYYLRDDLSFWLRLLVPQPSSPAAARRIAERILASGADLVKLFTGSYIARGTVKNMSEPVARAAVEVAHRHGKLVYSHASNLEGTRVAIRSGVDVLAHPPDSTEGIDEAILHALVDRHMSMTPTLKMFADTASSHPTYLGPTYEVVRRFGELGGDLLFGTDVGYMHDYSTDDEFRALGRCGLDGRAILRMLTTAPARRFGGGADASTVQPGQLADLVLLDSDPMDDPVAFARVRATIRGGRVLYLRADA
ncbi:MAG: amidohydrolase family protein [Thermoplasmata archaeon]